MDELFDKYGKDTILDGHRADLRRDRAQVPQRRRRSSPTASTRPSSFIDDDGVKRGRAGADPRQGHGRPRQHDHRPLRLLGRAQGGDQFAHLAGARVAYKALTGPLEPVNEGSFRALKVIIPEGNIMMARFPAPMAGWSMIVPTVVDTIVKALRRRCRTGCRPAITALLGGAVVFFGVHPKTQAPLRRAEHRRRRLGRPADRGRRVRHGLGLPGRRAQRARSRASS